MNGHDHHVEYLVAGIGTAVIPALLLAAGITIPGFGFTFELHKVDFSYNLSMFLYVALIFAGVAIMACYFRSVRIQPASRELWQSAGRLPGQHRVVSVPWSRLVAGGLLVAVGVLSFALLGIGFTDRNKIGIWLYLGGPSVSFPAGLIPLITGAVLVAYALAAVKVVVVHEKCGLLTIRELRPLSEIRTSIPTRDIRLARATNADTGPRLLWIAFFGFQVFLLLVDGLSLLGNPHAFGTGYLVGGMYVLSACVQIVSVVLLLFGGNQSLTIITTEKVYTLYYHALPRLGRAPSAGVPSMLEKMLGTAFPSAFRGDKRELQHPADLKRLILGIGLLTVPVVSRAFYVYAGELLWFPFLVFGGIVLVQWIKSDYASGGARVVRGGIAGAGPEHVLSARGRFYEEYLVNAGMGGLPRQQARVDPAPVLRPRLLLPPDHLVTLGVALLVGLDIFMTVLLAPAGNPFSPGAIALHVAIGTVLLLVTFVTSFDPKDSIDFKVAHWTFQVPAAHAGGGPRGWSSRMAGAMRKRPGIAALVVIEMAVAFCLGMAGAFALFFG
ncbi:MAG: hypothetical protein JW839_06015 [Candidatus Lokiarchaeota archaeon]|nr:hypothetical protein [Candidatus Lokiarchaeota archaeon]